MMCHVWEYDNIFRLLFFIVKFLVMALIICFVITFARDVCLGAVVAALEFWSFAISVAVSARCF